MIGMEKGEIINLLCGLKRSNPGDKEISLFEAIAAVIEENNKKIAEDLRKEVTTSVLITDEIRKLGKSLT